MSKTPREVEEYLQRFGAPQAAPQNDPVSEYLRRYGPAGAAPSTRGNVTSTGAPRATTSPLAALAGGVAQGGLLGFGDEIAAGIDAATTDRTLDESLARARQRQDLLRSEHPGLSTVGHIGGGIGTAVASGGTSLIPRGAGALAKLGIGAGAGAAGGAVAGFGEAEGGLGPRLEGAKSGAKLGLLFGAGAGVAAPALGRLGTAVADVSRIRGGGAPAGVRGLRDRAVRNVQERADDLLLQALERGDMTVEQVRNELARRAAAGAKPETIMEVGGQPMQRLGRAVRTAPGRGSARMETSLAARSAGAEERITADLLETTGQGQRTNPFAHIDELIEERRANARPLYERAYAAGPIDDPEILDLMNVPQFEAAYRRAQRIAKAEGLALPDLAKGGPLSVQAIDYTKRGLDDLIESRMRGGAMGRTEARALRNRLNDVLTRVDEAVPEYGAARRQFAGDSELIEAAERGRDLFRTHPDEARRYLDTLSESGKDAYRKQALGALQDRIENIAPGNNISRRVAEKTMDQRRLRLLFEDDESFARFQEAIRREAEMHAAGTMIRSGSQTADKLTELMDLAGVSVDMLMSPMTGLRSALEKVGRSSAVNAVRGVTERNAEALSRRLTLGMGNIPEEHRVLMEALAEAQRRAEQQATRRAGTTLGAGVAGGLSGGRGERK